MLKKKKILLPDKMKNEAFQSVEVSPAELVDN